MSDEKKKEHAADTPQRPQPPAPAPAPPTDPVQEASEESFPASDPPAWEPLHTGAPRNDRR